MATNFPLMFKYMIFNNVPMFQVFCPVTRCPKIKPNIFLFLVSTQSKTITISPQIIDASYNSEKVVRIVLYGPPLTNQISRQPASPCQLPSNKYMYETGTLSKSRFV